MIVISGAEAGAELAALDVASSLKIDYSGYILSEQAVLSDNVDYSHMVKMPKGFSYEQKWCQT